MFLFTLLNHRMTEVPYKFATSIIDKEAGSSFEFSLFFSFPMQTFLLQHQSVLVVPVVDPRHLILST